MPTRRLQHEPKVSQTQRALAIYRDHLKMVEQGRHDESRSWRQAVLASFAQSLDVAIATRATLYNICQKREGLKVNEKFEIVRLDGTKVFPSASGKRASVTKPALKTPVQMTPPPAPTTPLPKKRGRPPKSSTATAAVGTGTVPAKRAAPAPAPARVATPIPAPAAPAPKTNSPAKQRAEKAYADLIALCEGEIADAFQTLEELIDNVDQFGEAATLKKFTRQVRAACKQIDQQLGTKALLDKKQANKILPGIKE